MNFMIPVTLIKKYFFNKIAIDDCTYRPGTIVLVDICQLFPVFGRIAAIYAIDEKIIFDYTPLKTHGFSEHYFGFTVAEEEIIDSVAFHDLVLRTSFVIFRNVENELLVIGRHIF